MGDAIGVKEASTPVDRFWPLLVLTLIGLVSAGLGFRDVLTLRRMRRSGVWVEGVVARHHYYDECYFPVVSFSDERSRRREFTSKLGRERLSSRYAVGSSVRVVYLEGHPETAQLDELGYKVGTLGMYFLVGAVCLTFALLVASGR